MGATSVSYEASDLEPEVQVGTSVILLGLPMDGHAHQDYKLIPGVEY